MKKVTKTVFVVSVTVLLSACACKTVRTRSGQVVKLPKCTQTVFYSGNSLKIADISIPLTNDKVSIKGIDWDTKSIQQAAPAIAAMDQMRLRLCEDYARDVQVLEYRDFLEKDKNRQPSQEKLDQLAFLVASNNPQAVDRWITTYLVQTSVASISSLTETNNVLGTNSELKNELSGKSNTSVRFEPRNVDVQSLQELLEK